VDENAVALQKAITFRAMRLGVKKIGFADLSGVGLDLTDRFPCAIALIIPMDAAIVGGAAEPAFFEHQVRQREELEAVKAELGKLLAGHGYGFHPVSNDMDPGRLTGELSHKMVANIAGQGWIGKSTLFVTPEYGPRLRLTSLLTDAPFSTRAAPRWPAGAAIATFARPPARPGPSGTWSGGRARAGKNCWTSAAASPIATAGATAAAATAVPAASTHACAENKEQMKAAANTA
jgi:hypothetical protein